MKHSLQRSTPLLEAKFAPAEEANSEIDDVIVEIQSILQETRAFGEFEPVTESDLANLDNRIDNLEFPVFVSPNTNAHNSEPMSPIAMSD